MNSRILYIVTTAAVLLSSCITQNGIPQAEEPQNATGTFVLPQLSFSEAIDVVNTTRADDPRVANFLVTITDRSNGSEYLAGTVTEIKEQAVDGALRLPVGNYTITITSHNVEDVAWEEPYYRATQNFEIVKDTQTELANMVCKLSNIAVSVKYTAALLAELTKNDGEVDVFFGTEKLTYGQTETRAGFFKADNSEGVAYEALYWEFSGTVDGEPMVDNGLVKPVQAGQHQILTFDIQKTPIPGEGEIQFEFTISVSVQTIDLNLNIDVTEEVVEPYNPAVEIISDYKDGQRHVIKKSELSSIPVRMTLGAAAGLKNVYLALSVKGNDTAAGMLASMGLDKTIDLANPGAMETLFASVGLPVGSAVKGQQRVNVDFATLFAGLFALGAVPELDIKVDVYDSADNIASTTLMFELKDDTVPATIEIEGMDGFVLDEWQTIYKQDATQPTVGVEMTVPGKIAILTCRIVSEYPAFTPGELAGLGLTDNLNLTYPGDFEATIQALGLPCGSGYGSTPEQIESTAVLGKTSLAVDISGFLPLITMLYDDTPFDVEFVMTVEDEAGETASRSIMLHVEYSR
jgi:hypothetical protein